MGARRDVLRGRWRRNNRHATAPGTPLLRAPIGGLRRLQALAGRYLSVRAKLTIWYGLMCGVTLALAGTAMYLYVNHQLSSQIDGDLLSTTTQLNAQLSRPIAPAPRGYKLPAPRHRLQACAGFGAIETYRYCLEVQRILNVGSAVLSRPGGFEQVLLDVDPKSLYDVAKLTPDGRSLVEPSGLGSILFIIQAIGGQIHYATFTSGGHSFRLYVTPLDLPPNLKREGYGGLLEVFQNETTYTTVEHTVLVTLLLGIPLGLLIALFLGWWIARAALRPINRISRTVQSIGDSKDLSQRLSFVGRNDEVGRLASTFDGMMDRLERVFETQKRFIADASHELRTPLTAIRGNADLMRIAPPEDREIAISAIRREAERMTRLVSDLLLLAETDVAEQDLQRSRVDLDELVIDVYRNVQLIADGRVDVILDETEPVCVEGDADRLKQLFLNLSDNAVKFTPAGGTVSMGVSREGSEARVFISDSGIGIAPEEQAAIFQRFYRVERSRSMRGSGLGLAICAWIAQAHGGRLTVSSEPNKGSTFTVYLPLVM